MSYYHMKRNEKKNILLVNVRPISCNAWLIIWKYYFDNIKYELN